MRKVILTLWLGILFSLTVLPAAAQDGQELINALLSIKRSMSEVRADIAEAEQRMAAAGSDGQREFWSRRSPRYASAWPGSGRISRPSPRAWISRRPRTRPRRTWTGATSSGSW